jgi:hypothetical protein
VHLFLVVPLVEEMEEVRAYGELLAVDAHDVIHICRLLNMILLYIWPLEVYFPVRQIFFGSVAIF